MATPCSQPHRDDLSIAFVGLAGGLVLWLLGQYPQADRPLDGAWVLLPLTVTAGLEMLRRVRPQTALLLGFLALVGDQFTSGSLATVLMFTDLVYAAVLYGSRSAAQRIPVIAGLVTVTATVGFIAWYGPSEAVFIGVVIGLVTLVPAATGALVRNHREAADSARLQARQSIRLAEMDRAQAITAERTRMARELHDMVANRLTAIALHSTAALSLDDPGNAKNALAVIRENGVEGLSEMRRLIGLLRDRGSEADPAPVPTLDGLGALVARARTNGLDVTVDDTRPPGPELPSPVDFAAYRITQESLTNALKHAAPGPVIVHLAQQDDVLTVQVSSPFADHSEQPEVPGSGAGLIGMRERVALLHGSFQAGPQVTPDGRCWQVCASLPIDQPVLSTPAEGTP
ncbi:histidine kinase [Streptomyces griseoviridis]|uniref:histidine kinase n=1 Tax=Streptomyces griseoviridis TaxID=45398 RepID=A0A3Q9KWR1_STRGD|nr:MULTISPECIES: histidine kinase [Streptomyces]AZS85893.1 two-component sensor histidine kinase [Streptomyces griseoviridis]EDY44930.1 two-component system sensor kinase [Streptomyces sp. SPB074]MDH6703263.1 signal transduction histidine kinase [Streptomyces sp. MAA16]QCN87247.1 two-component sensor histidine kinase [Streptomyces griseoviridis]